MTETAHGADLRTAFERVQQVASPNQPVAVGVAPTDPVIRELAEDCLNSLKYSFAVAAANQKVDKPGTNDLMFRNFLATRKPAVRARYQTFGQNQLNRRLGRAGAFGRYDAVDPTRYATVGSDQMHQLITRAPIDTARIKINIDREPPRIKLNPDFVKYQADLAAGAKYKKLGLFLKYVYCIERTDGWGDDEIGMGGTIGDPDGKSRQMPFLRLPGDFDSHDSVFFPGPPKNPDLNKLMEYVKHMQDAPGHKLAEWTLRTDLKWPTHYATVISMSELDDTGFREFLVQLWKSVGTKWKEGIKSGLEKLGEAYLGQIGKWLAQAVAYVVNKILDWLFGDDQDEPLGTVALVMSLGDATKSYYDWTGLNKAPHPGLFQINYAGDGGRYRAHLYYQIYA